MIDEKEGGDFIKVTAGPSPGERREDYFYY
jgi:hypothetical protein